MNETGEWVEKASKGNINDYQNNPEELRKNFLNMGDCLQTIRSSKLGKVRRLSKELRGWVLRYRKKHPARTIAHYNLDPLHVPTKRECQIFLLSEILKRLEMIISDRESLLGRQYVPERSKNPFLMFD